MLISGFIATACSTLQTKLERERERGGGREGEREITERETGVEGGWGGGGVGGISIADINNNMEACNFSLQLQTFLPQPQHWHS